mgnify:CR=1 FL=1
MLANYGGLYGNWRLYVSDCIELRSAEFCVTFDISDSEYQSDMKGNANYIPMGTGPYKYNSQLSTGKLLFSAFDNYHNGRAKIDSLYAYTVPDLQKYESMFEASEIDLMTGRTVDLSEYTPRGSAKK